MLPGKPIKEQEERTSMQNSQKEDSIPSHTSLRHTLSHPCQQLQEFDEMQADHMSIPYRLWGWQVVIAVGGSLLYGASLSLHFRKWRVGRSALLLALSAGGGLGVLFAA